MGMDMGSGRFIAESFDAGLQNVEARFEVSAVVFPTANGGGVKRFADGLVGWRGNRFGFETLAIGEHTRIPRQSEEIQSPARLAFEVSHAILVTNLQPRTANLLPKDEPQFHVMCEALRRALEVQEAHAVCVQWQVLREARDDDIARIAQCDQEHRLREQTQHARQQRRQAWILVQMHAVADWVVQGGGHVGEIPLALRGQPILWDGIQRGGGWQWCSGCAPNRRENVATKGFPLVRTDQAWMTVEHLFEQGRARAR